jgi:hypothetical protein
MITMAVVPSPVLDGFEPALIRYVQYNRRAIMQEQQWRQFWT